MTNISPQDRFIKIANRPMNATEQKLFTRTFQHPVIGSMVEWVPCTWLTRLANPEVKGGGGLGNWDKSGPLPKVERVGVDDDTLFANMVEQGMRDPFYVGVGRINRYVRLETGNHRLRIMTARGIAYVPAVAYVGDIEMTNTENGLHRGTEMALKLPEQVDIMGPYPIKEYRRLSDVLVEMPR